MKNMALYIAIGVAAVLVVVAAAGATAYLMMNRMGGTARPAASENVLVELKEGTVVELEEFTTNLADQDRPRYIKVTFQLVARDTKEAEKLNGSLPLVRDTIVGVLNAKKSMEVTGESGANTLKAEIQKKVNERLGAPYVQSVLMTDFVVQF